MDSRWTVWREHNLEKVSFFCDAKKAENKVAIITINEIKMSENKTDYIEVLEMKSFLMLNDSLFFY